MSTVQFKINTCCIYIQGKMQVAGPGFSTKKSLVMLLL